MQSHKISRRRAVDEQNKSARVLHTVQYGHSLSLTTVNCRLEVAVSLAVFLSIPRIYIRQRHCNGVFWDKPATSLSSTRRRYVQPITDYCYDNQVAGGRRRRRLNMQMTRTCHCLLKPRLSGRHVTTIIFRVTTSQAAQMPRHFPDLSGHLCEQTAQAIRRSQGMSAKF